MRHLCTTLPSITAGNLTGHILLYNMRRLCFVESANIAKGKTNVWLISE